MEKTSLANRIDKEKAVKIAHIVYAVLLISLAVVVGILFIVSVVGVYNSQEVSPFTVDAIESHFRAIAVPVIMLPCLVLIGFVLHFLFPLEAKQKKVENDKALATLSEKVNLDLASSGTKKLVIRERYFRLGAILGSVLIWISALAVILAFALNSANYSSANPNSSVKDLALVVFPSALISIGVSYAVSIVNKLSKKRELALLKGIVKENKDALDGNGKNGLAPFVNKIFEVVNKIKGVASKRENLSLWLCRGALLVIAVVFIVLGVLNGGMDDVLAKAIRICTECIGLG